MKLSVTREFFALFPEARIALVMLRGIDNTRRSDEAELLLGSDDAYFRTPHYDGHPILLVRLDRVGRRQLEERIEDSWLLRAPKRLVDAYLAERS